MVPTLLLATAPRVALDTVVLTGEAAPDGNGVFQSFSTPILNDLGQVAFHAFLTETTGGEADDFGLYRGETNSGPQQIIREGQVAPDGNGTFYINPSDLIPPSINSTGQVAFRGLFITNTGERDNTGVYRWDGENQLVTIARLGSEVVGHPIINSFDGYNTFFRQPDLNDSGQVAFLSEFVPHDEMGVPIRGVLLGDGASPIELAAQTFQETPDGNDRLGSFISASPVINNAGQAAIATGTLDLHREGIFLGDGSGGLVQMARDGQGILGTDETLRSFNTAEDMIALNDLGQVAFVGETDRLSLNDAALFISDGPGDLTRIVRAGQATPDGNGVFSFDFLPNPSVLLLNSRGQVAFRALLSGASSGQVDGRGIYVSDSEGDLLQVAREGQAAPGGDGVLSGLSFAHLNDTGQVAFSATVDATANEDDYQSIYLYDELQGLIEIAREGQAYQGSTLTQISLFDSLFNGNRKPPGSNRSSLNEAGQVAFSFTLADDRRGVAIASVVPEPSTLLLAIAYWAALQQRRQRRSRR